MGLFEIMLIFLAILLVGLGAWLAKSRGRNPIIWGILSFFFPVLALPILLIIPKR